LQAKSEENFQILCNLGESLEKKDGGNVKEWRDTVCR
jgi:hypothetical protein